MSNYLHGEDLTKWWIHRIPESSNWLIAPPLSGPHAHKIGRPLRFSTGKAALEAFANGK